MPIKRLWTPWRMKYIQQNNQTSECIFCRALQQEDGLENLVLFRGNRAFVILNLYPYAGGHLMVVPVDHKPTLPDLDTETQQELIGLLSRSEDVLRKVYQPQGLNFGANVGVAAGAGVADHFHFHIIPRWTGDTNFMSTVGETRILPEELGETYRRLKSAW
jgi:ATP adenylyltransferase